MRGALRGAGSTLAVIGTGADRIYPARNAALARRIAAEGAIVSEFPLAQPLQHHFPRRNRLIADCRGGAGGRGRDWQRVADHRPSCGGTGPEVFAIPGSIHSPLSKAGCHRLIRDGAKLVETAQDVLEELRWESLPAAPAGRRAPLPSAPRGSRRAGVSGRARP